MKEKIDITEIEAAINYWREVNPTTRDNPVLSAPVLHLADIYGAMIWERSDSVACVSLTAPQLAALTNVPASAFERAQAAQAASNPNPI